MRPLSAFPSIENLLNELERKYFQAIPNTSRGARMKLTYIKFVLMSSFTPRFSKVSNTYYFSTLSK